MGGKGPGSDLRKCRDEESLEEPIGECGFTCDIVSSARQVLGARPRPAPTSCSSIVTLHVFHVLVTAQPGHYCMESRGQGLIPAPFMLCNVTVVTCFHKALFRRNYLPKPGNTTIRSSLIKLRRQRDLREAWRIVVRLSSVALVVRP